MTKWKNIGMNPSQSAESPDDSPILPAGKLERIVGKNRKEWNIDDLIEVVREHKIRLVSLMHIGGDGWLKALDFVPRDFSHLYDILSAGERTDGSSLFQRWVFPQMHQM